MPETTFDVRWPDGSPERLWSPSTVIGEHLQAGDRYPLEEFLARSRAGLQHASDRVRERYGFGCTASAEQLRRIEARAADFAGGDVEVVAIT